MEREKATDMEFMLKANLKCSGSLSEAVSSDELTEFVNYCNAELLKKGAPPGCGAEVVSWAIAADKLGLEIVSDRFVRAHDALLRLKNEFGKFLGKHRIGIRGMEIEDYEITMDWDTELKLKKLPFVKEEKQEAYK